MRAKRWRVETGGEAHEVVTVWGTFGRWGWIWLDDEPVRQWVSWEKDNSFRVGKLQVDISLSGRFKEKCDLLVSGESIIGDSLYPRVTWGDQQLYALFSGLRWLGLEAHMTWDGNCAGTWGSAVDAQIEVKNSPIRWVNQFKSTESSSIAHTRFAIPDARILPRLPDVRISTVRVKKRPVIGKVVDAFWKGDDLAQVILDRLHDDPGLTSQVVDKGDISIISHPQYRCWVVRTGGWQVPSKESWEAYEAMGRHLLAAPISARL